LRELEYGGTEYVTEEGVRYYLIACKGGYLRVDTSSLVKSKSFKRQLEAVKRLETANYT